MVDVVQTYVYPRLPRLNLRTIFIIPDVYLTSTLRLPRLPRLQNFIITYLYFRVKISRLPRLPLLDVINFLRLKYVTSTTRLPFSFAKITDFVDVYHVYHSWLFYNFIVFSMLRLPHVYHTSTVFRCNNYGFGRRLPRHQNFTSTTRLLHVYNTSTTCLPQFYRCKSYEFGRRLPHLPLLDVLKLLPTI